MRMRWSLSPHTARDRQAWLRDRENLGRTRPSLACSFRLLGEQREPPAHHDPATGRRARRSDHPGHGGSADPPATTRNRPVSHLHRPCLDDTNPQSAAGRVVVARGYWLRGIAQSGNATIGEQVLQLWRKKGWVISTTEGIGTSAPQITALPSPTLPVSLQSSDNGSLSLGASSVCIWPNGTPPES